MSFAHGYDTPGPFGRGAGGDHDRSRKAGCGDGRAGVAVGAAGYRDSRKVVRSLSSASDRLSVAMWREPPPQGPKRSRSVGAQPSCMYGAREPTPISDGTLNSPPVPTSTRVLLVKIAP